MLIVVPRDNGDRPSEIYEALEELGARFIHFIAIAERKGTRDVSDRSVLPEQFGRFLVDVFECRRKADIGSVFVQHFDAALNAVTGNPWTLCAHAPRCGRAVALEHNGDLYACDHFVTREYLLGDIRQTPYAELIESSFQTGFGAAREQGLAPGCVRCRVRGLCHGGCPAHRFIDVRASALELNYLCQGYLAFFTHVEPYLEAMQRALLAGEEARALLPLPRFAEGATRSQRSWPCGSGKKYKHCCGR